MQLQPSADLPNYNSHDRFPLIVIIADGWTQRIFQECLENNLLPEISDELISNGHLFTNVIAPFPSVSIASHTSLLTGVSQNQHFIPGHRWVEHATSLSRNYIGPHVFKVNSDISPEVKTIFEKYSNFNTVAVQSIVRRGALHKVILPTRNSEVLLAETGKIAAKRNNSVIVTWLPKGDIISHIYGPDSPLLVNEMISTSKGIGRLVKHLRKAGIFNSARILFTPDHGQKAVSKHIDLRETFEKIGLVSELNVHGKTNSGKISIHTSGDAIAYVYFPNKVLQEEKYNILKDLAYQSGIELIFFRRTNDVHFIFSSQGISCLEVKESDNITYRLIEGKDPLELLNNIVAINLNIKEPSEILSHTVYPDILHQYLKSYVPHRSSDVVIVSASDVHFGKVPRLGWRFGYHKGSHGGPTRNEMLLSSIATGITKNIDPKKPVRLQDLISKCYFEN
ncbi:MAG: alkaline phosphatase family protein [Ignavibacteriaceae bacterium]